MSVTFSVRRGAVLIAVCDYRSVWQDIPLHRALLALRLDGALPAVADWEKTPAGSEEGVQLYRSYTHLRARWLDEHERPVTALDRVLDCELRQVSTGTIENPQTSVAVKDVVEALSDLVDAVRRRDASAYAYELSLALGVLSLCSIMRDGGCMRRTLRPERRTNVGAIFYFTSGLEGFDEIKSVRLRDGGVILCTFRSGFAYRIPVEYLLPWTGEEGVTAPAVAARKSPGGGGGAIAVRLESGRIVRASTSTIPRYCEPLYVDASLRSAWEEALVRHAQSTYGDHRRLRAHRAACPGYHPNHRLLIGVLMTALQNECGKCLMIQRMTVAMLVLLAALPLAAGTLPGTRSWRVMLAAHAGPDPAATARRLAAMYRGELETPVDAQGAFLIALTDAAAALLEADPAVQAVQPEGAEALPSSPSPTTTVSTPQIVANATASWSLGTYSYDGSGNIEKIGTDPYVYDLQNRLVSGVAGGKTEQYTYDEFGNILTIETTGSAKPYLGVDPATNRMSQTTGIVGGQT